MWGIGGMEMRVTVAGGYVRIEWLKQRALEKLLGAGISRLPPLHGKLLGQGEP